MNSALAPLNGGFLFPLGQDHSLKVLAACNASVFLHTAKILPTLCKGFGQDVAGFALGTKLLRRTIVSVCPGF
jgi:hypothetical protein